METIKITYNKWTCRLCGKKFSMLFQDLHLCWDCSSPIHDVISQQLRTENKLIFKTKIDHTRRNKQKKR